MSDVLQKRNCSICKNDKNDSFCSFCNKETPSDINIQVHETVKVVDNLKMTLRDQLNKILSIFISRFKTSRDPNSLHPEVHETMVIDKPKGEYYQVVKDAATQEVIHEEHEKLTEHKPNPPQPINATTAQFIKGQPNKSNGPNSIEVRKIINDEFGGGKQAWDLQCTEYTQFRVNQAHNIKIDWPRDRTLSRHGRNWAKILENRYKVSSTPKIGCAMSFTHPAFNNPFGHVAFVEEVLVDGSVRISEANWPGNGIYNERVVKKDDLETKYQARFIDFT